MEEVWRDIPCFEGKYRASSLGRVRSYPRISGVGDYHSSSSKPGKILAPVIHTGGYLYVSLSVRGVIRTIRLTAVIAATFLDTGTGRFQVCHLNEEITDDSLNNLKVTVLDESGALPEKPWWLRFKAIGKERRKTTSDDYEAVEKLAGKGIPRQEVRRRLGMGGNTLNRITGDLGVLPPASKVPATPPAKVRRIRRLSSQGFTNTEISKKVGVGKTCVGNILSGKSRSTVK